MRPVSWTPRVLWLVRAALLLASSGAVAAACSGGDDRPDEGLDIQAAGGAAGAGGEAQGGGEASSCDNGDSRECHVTIGEHNGVVTCYVGVEICVDGAWGACGDGTTYDLDLPEGTPWKSFSPPAQCQNNPCDPECKAFAEQPPGGSWDADGTAFLYGWPSGNPTGVPPAQLDKGRHIPCQTGEDCQMNSYCYDPLTGNCPHSECSIGVGMTPGCGSCVDRVCAQNPTCCAKPYGGASCAHSECTSGGALTSGCSSCATTVCAADPYCCQVSWDATCTQEAKMWCGATCNVCDGQTCAHDVCTTGAKLNKNCDTCVASVCASDPYCCATAWDGQCVSKAFYDLNCPSGGGTVACVHDPCSTGNKLQSGCANYVADVCAQKPACCGSFWDASCVTAFNALSPGGCPSSWPGSWTQSCVNAVDTVCGASCKSPPTDTGQCIGWNPGETDPTCAGIDLSIGWTCDGTIPVCNHGNSTAPAGITVMHIPADQGFFGGANPPANIAGKVTCQTQEPIAPGECVAVSCPGLSPYREIMVNPPPGGLTECYRGDNWGIYVPGTCGPPTCAGTAVKANLKPVNMFIAFDKSGSMQGARWNNSKAAFTAFFQDPQASGLNVALEFFGYSAFGTADGCYNNAAECGSPTKCANAYVPLGALTAQPAPADAQELKLVQSFNQAQLQPGGQTPALLAFQGCQQWAAGYSAGHPNEKQVCILVTDGEPNDCGAATGPFVTAAASGYASHGVLSYGIGIVGANPVILDAIAVAGHGQAYYVGNANMTQDLINALNAIKGQALSCDLPLPGGTYNPADATVSYQPGNGGSPVVLAQVASAASCGPSGGWYLDNPNNPTKITLCPVTCNTVKADLTGSVELYLPCPGNMHVTTYRELYEADCPDGLTPQWGYFAYDTTCPSNSRVTFTARTGSSQAEIAAATPVALATAQSTPTNTQICPMAPNGTCPVDLFVKLGLPEAHDQFLELIATLTPNSGNNAGPLVNNWEITYSCVAAE